MSSESLSETGSKIKIAVIVRVLATYLETIPNKITKSSDILKNCSFASSVWKAKPVVVVVSWLCCVMSEKVVCKHSLETDNNVVIYRIAGRRTRDLLFSSTNMAAMTLSENHLFTMTAKILARSLANFYGQ